MSEKTRNGHLDTNASRSLGDRGKLPNASKSVGDQGNTIRPVVECSAKAERIETNGKGARG